MIIHALLLDTNIIAEPTKPQPNQLVANRIIHLLSELIDINMPIIPYTAEAARWFATERSRLVSRGLTPSYPDGQIAAIAATNHLILVTRNTSDFIHFDGLQLENWFE